MKYLKKSFSQMEVYFSKNIEQGVILNANEAPYLPPKKILDEYHEIMKEVAFNRYPDMANISLCKAIGEHFNVPAECVTCGVGSDELLEVVFRATLEPNDYAVSFSPSFSMYQVFADLALAKFIPVYFNEDLSFDVDKMIDTINEYKPKLVTICTPNNPTGQVLSRASVKKIVEATDALVLLDLAYVDFADEDLTDLALKYDNLIVFRTFSKAMALPSIRCGYAIAKKDNIDLINAVKAPYSLSIPSQILAELAIKNYDLYKDLIADIKSERTRIYNELKDLGFEVYDSQANFIFVKMDDKYNEALLANLIYIRKFKSGVYRITVGSQVENDLLIEVIKNASR